MGCERASSDAFLDALDVNEVHWELTNHCNLKCVHCYLSEDERRELSTVEIKRVMDELYDAGCLALTLTGGEPLLRADFPDLYAYAHSRGFLIHVFTNGTRITPKIVALFQEKPPRVVEITLNGITAETFEKVTAVEGSFKTCMEGIRRLYEGGVPLTLKTNGMTLNIAEVLQIKAFAGTMPGVKYKFDTAIMPRRDHDMAPTQYRLQAREIIALYEDDRVMKKEIKDSCNTWTGQTPVEGAAFQCAAGKARFHISAWGDLHPCHTVRPLRVSLHTHSFQEARTKLRTMVDGVKYPPESKCGTCKIHLNCASCPGLAHLEGKSQVLPTAYHCDVAHEVVKTYA